MNQNVVSKKTLMYELGCHCISAWPHVEAGEACLYLHMLRYCDHVSSRGPKTPSVWAPLSLSHTHTRIQIQAHTQYNEYTSVEMRMAWHKGAPPPLAQGHYDLNRPCPETPSVSFIRHVRRVSAQAFLLHRALVAELGSQFAVLHL